MLNRRNLLWVVLVSLLARLAFLGLFNQQPEYWLTQDSPMYLQIAQGMLDSGDYMRYASDGQTLIRETERVPGYALYLALFFALLGPSLLWPLLGQLLLDTGTCVLSGLLARELEPRAFLAGGLLGAVNLNLVVHANLILTETLFLFLFTAHLVTALRFVRVPSVWTLLGSGLLLGAALMTRPVAMYWVPVFTAFTGFMSWRRHRQALVPLRDMLIALLAAGLLCLPLYARNHQAYGYWKLVDQNGVNFLYWYAPLVMSFASDLSWEEGKRIMDRRVGEELAARQLDALPSNPFERSALLEAVGRRALVEQGLQRIAYAWAGGALVNSLAPSMSAVGYLERMERPRFYAAEGDHVLAKAWNFLLHPDNRLYLLLMLPAIVLTLISRVFLLVGMVGPGLTGRRARR